MEIVGTRPSTEYQSWLKITGTGGWDKGFRKEILNTVFTAVPQFCVLQLCVVPMWQGVLPMAVSQLRSPAPFPPSSRPAADFQRNRIGLLNWQRALSSKMLIETPQHVIKAPSKSYQAGQNPPIADEPFLKNINRSILKIALPCNPNGISRADIDSVQTPALTPAPRQNRTAEGFVLCIARSR